MHHSKKDCLTSQVRTDARKSLTGGFTFFRGAWHSENERFHWFILSHISIWETWSFLWVG